MNVSQVARNQQMMYNIISKGEDYASRVQSKYSGSDVSVKVKDKEIDETDSILQQMGVKNFDDSDLLSMSDVSFADRAKADADKLLEQIGIKDLEGRTVREMAQYQMSVREAAQDDISEASLYSDLLAQSQQSPSSIRTQYTPISDEATKAMQNLALQDAVNSVGKADSSTSSSLAPNSRERASLIQEQLKEVDPSKRLSAFNTMNKVWESELDRIGNYIQQNDSSWTTWGDSFNTDILKGYIPGVNIWT